MKLSDVNGLKIPEIQDFPQDPNHTAWDEDKSAPYEDGEKGGAYKITKTDMSGPEMEIGQTGIGKDKPYLNPVKNDSTSLPEASSVPVMTFGNPGDTSGNTQGTPRYGFGEENK